MVELTSLLLLVTAAYGAALLRARTVGAPIAVFAAATRINVKTYTAPSR